MIYKDVKMQFETAKASVSQGDNSVISKSDISIAEMARLFSAGVGPFWNAMMEKMVLEENKDYCKWVVQLVARDNVRVFTDAAEQFIALEMSRADGPRREVVVLIAQGLSGATIDAEHMLFAIHVSIELAKFKKTNYLGKKLASKIGSSYKGKMASAHVRLVQLLNINIELT